MKEKLIKLSESRKIASNLFFLSLIVFLISNFLFGTMLNKYLPNGLTFKLTELSGMLAIFKILIFDMLPEREKWKNHLILILLGLIIWQACSMAFNYNIFYYYLMVIGAKNVKGKNILQVFFVSILASTAFVVLCAKLGIIPGLAFGRGGSSVLRYALGMVYPSDLAARIFYLMLVYVVYKRFKLDLPEYISLGAILVFAYVVTDTRLDSLLMGLLLLGCILYRYLKKAFTFLGALWIGLISNGVICLMILMSYFYNSHIKILELLNKALSGRLHYGRMAFDKYNVELFGQYVPQIGYGGSDRVPKEYFYLDSSFMRLLMMNGVLSFVLLMILLMIVFHKFMRQRSYSLVMFVLFVIMSSLIDQHLFEISYNVAFLLLLSDNTYFSERGSYDQNDSLLART